MNRKTALIGAGILSAIAVFVFVLWVSTERSRAESQAVVLQAKTAYASGHAVELTQYATLLNNVGYLIPQIALLVGIILLGAAVLRMSFALSRRIEGRIISRGERNEINSKFYIAPPKTRVAKYLSDNGISSGLFDPRDLSNNREVVDAGRDETVTQKPAHSISTKQRNRKPIDTTRRK